MKIHKVEQQSMEWLALRAGIPTASEWDNIVTPAGEPRKGEMPKTYLAKKLEEWWIGGPAMGGMTIDMESGKIREDIAIPWYEVRYNVDINRVGFITDEKVTIGCSPDGLIGDDCGIEVKCPLGATQIKYLLAGRLPQEYVAQVQGSMLVTGFTRWKFMAYRPGFPHLVLNVDRDEEFCKNLRDSLDGFLERFEEGKSLMIQLNDGRPPKKNTFRERILNPTPQPQSDDIIP